MIPEQHLGGAVRLYNGDSRDVLKSMPDNSVDSVCTDPPYALVSIVKRFGADGAAPTRDGDVYARSSAGFMNQSWDTGETAFAVEFWAEVFRVLKPGGHIIAFSGTRTYHRLAVAIEDAGFEIRDMISWLYGSGFPKSHDVSKGIDKHLGVEREPKRIPASEVGNLKARQDGRPFIEKAHERGFHEMPGDFPATLEAATWRGWGTALKPACEPCVLARKPLEASSIARNVLAHGTGALHIGACRVEAEKPTGWSGGTGKREGVTAGATHGGASGGFNYAGGDARPVNGRWPANVVHDGSPEVVAGFPQTGAAGSLSGSEPSQPLGGGVFGSGLQREAWASYADSGSAARFFYSAKADAMDRIGSKHPTVKPVDLMQWMCRLITPPGGVVLDPFAGSGTTGEAAFREGLKAILIEREADYCVDIRARLELATAGEKSKRRAIAKRKGGEAPLGGIFGEVA